MKGEMMAVDRQEQRRGVKRVMKSPVEKRRRLNKYVAPDSHTRQEMTGLLVATGIRRSA